MGERRLTYDRLDDLRPNPANAKGHDVTGVGASMDRFGVIDPIVVDERTGMLVSGHGRRETYLAARAAGTAPPAGARVDRAGEWTVPVVHGWASEDDQEAAAALVAVNRWVEVGGWDVATLAGQLQAIEASGGDGLAGVGFGRGDLDDLLARAEETADDGMGDFAAPDTPTASQVRSIMLDYPLETYGWMAETTARARAATGHASTAELLLALLEADAKAAG